MFHDAPAMALAEALDLLSTIDVQAVEGLLAGAPASPPAGNPDRARAIGALSDTTVRRNMADWLVDDAAASLLVPAGGEDMRWKECEALLVKAVLLAPDFVNAYYWLGEWHRALDPDVSPYERLRAYWQRYGASSASALQFVLQYRDGDPYHCSARLRELIGGGTALVLHMSDDLRYLDLLEYQGGRPHALAFVGRIERPGLMCAPREFRTLPASKQAIAEDLVKRGKDSRVVMHRGTCVQAGDRSVFGPAVDTLYCNRVLHETIFRNPAFMEAARTVCEVGTGTGFLLCSTLRAVRGPEIRLLASDVNPRALAVARANVERTIAERFGPADGPQVSFLLDDRSLARLSDGSVDLLLSNPPYVPTYRGDHPANPYEGTEVLQDLLVGHGPRVLSRRGIIVMLYSSLTAGTVARFLRQSPLVAVPLGEPLRVPLDLREVSNDPRWVRLLQRHHGLEVDLGSTDHVLWHELHVLMLGHPHNPLCRDGWRAVVA